MKTFNEYLGLGIAGNFALHLAQAGELEDFKDVITADEAAPKGLFPFYLPNYSPLLENPTRKPKEILRTYPLSSDTIKLPNAELNVQAEPEVGLICDIAYKDGEIFSITPTHFGAYNDCSIRVAGAEKISDKKNWGESSKGFSKTILKIDKFEEGGVMDEYSICSFLSRDGKLEAYGEDVELTGYSYFYEKLTQWIKNQINTQENFGPLEPINEYIRACNYPTKAIISIGATRYTEYGESTFLKVDDELFVVLYNRSKYSLNDVIKNLESRDHSQSDMSILAQKVL
ncbi:hypothetical protein GJV85_03295 [Sulfurimonas aquatica]|uniref:Uncharacterized protein n=1 Tax=Sulfurimonas aquatica TaxID=2672570 RepID=A0A975AYY9_9BACT|nr:DUF5718 family protein [Sulfurimonas aquatica]QSZ41176.1 hypothetical protein GJV85_03295 [Sulfurimonas aquatica]